MSKSLHPNSFPERGSLNLPEIAHGILGQWERENTFQKSNMEYDAYMRKNQSDSKRNRRGSALKTSMQGLAEVSLPNQTQEMLDVKG